MIAPRNPQHYRTFSTSREGAMFQNLGAISGKYPRTMKEAGMDMEYEDDEPFPMRVLAAMFLFAALGMLVLALM